MKLFLMQGCQYIKQSLDVICLKHVEVVFLLVLFISFLQTYLKLLANSLFWESDARQQVLQFPCRVYFQY